MNADSPWYFVIVGFIVVFLTVWIIQNYRARKLFKASFYTEIYSGFFEYNLKRKSLAKLSVSNWLNSQFKEHRIFFQMAKSKDNQPQAYILIILSSGVYVILCKNYIGKFIEKDNKYEVKTQVVDKKTKVVHKNVRKVSNPINEVMEFNQRLKKHIGVDYKEHNIVAFMDVCELKLDSDKEIPFIHRKELFNTIKKIHESSDIVMQDDEIVSLYNVFVRKTK